MSPRRVCFSSAIAALACIAAACGSTAPAEPPHAAEGPLVLTITEIDTRFVTREQMIAGFEMQQSGEPLAETFGRDLAGYDRNLLPTHMYTDPRDAGTGAPAEPTRDLVGFASAIETYEYSKQPMNNLAFESGAGVSLVYGPGLNPTALDGPEGRALLRPRIERFAIGSHLGVRQPLGAVPDRFFVLPAPTAWAPNVFGWRGLWPTLVPYRSFDPAIHPTVGLFGSCAIVLGDGDDGLGTQSPNDVGDYECDYRVLNIPRAAIDTTLGPGAAGWASWKYALWITNYLQIMHDTAGHAIGSVAPAEQSRVGSEANTIVGMQSAIGGDPSQHGVAGTYLGPSDVEGFQAALMIEELDQASLAWLTTWTTADGASLSGFTSVADALAYDYEAPLRWIPAEIAVTETPDPASPAPTYRIASSTSHLLDLLGLAGGYAQLYGLTDEHNPDTGGTVPARVYFDGDPFAHDDQIANGEATLHDRSLAILKLALVTLDRVHRDPRTGLFVDDVTFSGATPVRGATLSTVSASYVVTSLRAMRRALSSHLTLYSDTRPDVATVSTALDGTSMAGAPGGAGVATRLGASIRAHADVLLEQLTDETGRAHAGLDLRTRTPTGDGSLDDYAAAVGGLLEAYLATGDTRYRERASAVLARMERVFWDERARVYRPQPGDHDTFEFTPMRYALLTRALRSSYVLVAAQPGHEALAARIEARIVRMASLVLNGWDDRDGDGDVDWPEECLRVVDDVPRGGLQMAERALSGELGSEQRGATSDRDHDCVPEIDDAGLPAALANRIVVSVGP